MDMPDNCFECPCCEEEQWDYRGHILQYTCRAILDDVSDYERRPDCPLSEISTPHGRLIDADRLIKALEKQWNVEDDQDFANKTVWREIENAPTVIEAEE